MAAKSKSEERREAVQKEADEKDTVETTDEKSGDTVVVKKSDLEGFLKRLDTLEADNKRLINVADKGRLAHEREKQVAADGAPLIRTVKLTRLSPDGPIVVAWKMTANESYVDGNRMVEKQEIQVVFQDATSKEMRLIDFYRQQNKTTVAEIIKRSLNEKTGDTELEVELRDGERLTVPIAFVN